MKYYVTRLIMSISVFGCLFYFHGQKIDDGEAIAPPDMATTMEMSTNLKGYKRVDDGFKPMTQQGTFEIFRQKGFGTIDDYPSREEYHKTYVSFWNRQRDEALSVTTRCSQDGGESFSMSTTDVPEIENVCETNAGHFFFSAVSESGGCVWNDENCEHEYDGLCMKKVEVCHCYHELATIVLEPCNS